MATSEAVTTEILHAELAEFRSDMRAEFGQLRAEMAEFRADMYRAFWLFGSGIVAMLGVIVGVANALD